MLSFDGKKAGLGTSQLAAEGDRSAADDCVVGALVPAPASVPKVPRDGRPLDLDMGMIDEDPHQPRTENNPGFSEASLNELAAAIRLRGVKTPISVRENQDGSGRFVINHGARRFRGAKRAGKTTIPGFIDNDYNEADQVVENLLRNELTAREIADFVGRELAKGVKKGDIAKAISKSPAFVSQHVTLLDLPGPVAHAFNIGRVRDVTVVNALVMAFKKSPTSVTTWLADESLEITRGTVARLREFLDEKLHQKPADDEEREDNEGPQDIDASGGEGMDTDTAPARAVHVKPERLKHVIVRVRHDQRSARLILDRLPSIDGVAWLRYEDGGDEVEAALSKVRLVALVEG